MSIKFEDLKRFPGAAEVPAKRVVIDSPRELENVPPADIEWISDEAVVTAKALVPMDRAIWLGQLQYKMSDGTATRKVDIGTIQEMLKTKPSKRVEFTSEQLARV